MEPSGIDPSSGAGRARTGGEAEAVAGLLTKYAAQARLEAALLEVPGDDDE